MSKKIQDLRSQINWCSSIGYQIIHITCSNNIQDQNKKKLCCCCRAATLNEWELQTNSNVISANKEVNSTKRLRCYIDAMIKQTVDDLTKQKDITNEAFRQRIEQTREAKIKLELQHSEVCKIYLLKNLGN